MNEVGFHVFHLYGTFLFFAVEVKFETKENNTVYYIDTIQFMLLINYYKSNITNNCVLNAVKFQRQNFQKSIAVKENQSILSKVKVNQYKKN